jgi:hypothetical protein
MNFTGHFPIVPQTQLSCPLEGKATMRDLSKPFRDATPFSFAD